jgi:hypothetical protein
MGLSSPRAQGTRQGECRCHGKSVRHQDAAFVRGVNRKGVESRRGAGRDAGSKSKSTPDADPDFDPDFDFDFDRVREWDLRASIVCGPAFLGGAARPSRL